VRFTERVQAWLRREAADADELAADTRRRLDEDLSRRERELTASPEERVELLQGDIARNDEDFEALRRRLGPPPDDT
jgi:hypothetical protein